jgi:hypothetical protein
MKAILMTDVIDASARLAALQAATEAQAIFEQRPNLTAAERSAVIGNSLAQAHKDYLGSYVREEADVAFRKAVGEVCAELDGASIEHSTDDSENDDAFAAAYDRYQQNEFGLTARQAAEWVARRRAGR